MNAYKDDELVAQATGPLDELSEFAKNLLEHEKADLIEIFDNPSQRSFKKRIAELQR